MEASFRRNITEYLENLLGTEIEEENQFVTEGRFKVRITKFEPVEARDGSYYWYMTHLSQPLIQYI